MEPQRNLTKLEDLKREFVRQVIISRLRRYEGNQSRAAADLGVHRNTVARLMTEFEIDWRDFRHSQYGPTGNFPRQVRAPWNAIV